MSSVSLPDDHVPDGVEVFLDTSIHCCKLKGPSFTARIDKLLSMFSFTGSSSYSKVEFGNVVLSAAEYYLRSLRQTKSLNATLLHIGNVLNQKFHGRLITWSFNLLATTVGRSDTERTERAILSLTRLLKYGTRCIESDSDNVVDGTNCHWARKRLDRVKGVPVWKTPNCKQNKKLCKLDEFFQTNIATFQRIKIDIDNLPEDKRTTQLKDFSTVIDRALVDPQILLDYKTGCRKLADAIIAVDSLNYSNMFTQNSAESSVLCKTLGQTAYFLPPNEVNGVIVQLRAPDASEILERPPGGVKS